MCEVGLPATSPPALFAYGSTGFMMRHNDEMQPGRRLQSFNAADHLKDEETIRAYLQAALDDPTPGALRLALDNVTKARKSGVERNEARD